MRRRNFLTLLALPLLAPVAWMLKSSKPVLKAADVDWLWSSALTGAKAPERWVPTTLIMNYRMGEDEDGICRCSSPPASAPDENAQYVYTQTPDGWRLQSETHHMRFTEEVDAH